MITGQPHMSAEPLMEYFEPLITWLKEENKKNDETIGWPEYDWKPYSNGMSTTHPSRTGRYINQSICITRDCCVFGFLCQVTFSKLTAKDFRAPPGKNKKKPQCNNRGTHSVPLLLRLTVKSISHSSCLTDEIPLEGCVAYSLQIRLMRFLAAEWKTERGRDNGKRSWCRPDTGDSISKNFFAGVSERGAGFPVRHSGANSKYDLDIEYKDVSNL